MVDAPSRASSPAWASWNSARSRSYIVRIVPRPGRRSKRGGPIGSRAMDTSTALLTAGYVAAVPTTAGLLRIAWRRNLPLFLLLEAGVAAIVAGWAMKGERLPAWMNAGFGLGFLATWIAVGRVRRRREAAG